MYSGFAGAGSMGCLDKKWGQEKQSTVLRSAVPSHRLGSDGAALPASRAAGPPVTNQTPPGRLHGSSPGSFPFPSFNEQSFVRINAPHPRLLKRRQYIYTDLIWGAAMYRRRGRRRSRSRTPIILRGSGEGRRSSTGRCPSGAHQLWLFFPDTP